MSHLFSLACLLTLKPMSGSGIVLTAAKPVGFNPSGPLIVTLTNNTKKSLLVLELMARLDLTYEPYTVTPISYESSPTIPRAQQLRSGKFLRCQINIVDMVDVAKLKNGTYTIRVVYDDKEVNRYRARYNYGPPSQVGRVRSGDVVFRVGKGKITHYATSDNP